MREALGAAVPASSLELQLALADGQLGGLLDGVDVVNVSTTETLLAARPADESSAKLGAREVDILCLPNGPKASRTNEQTQSLLKEETPSKSYSQSSEALS